jgi:hypothetical protein
MASVTVSPFNFVKNNKAIPLAIAAPVVCAKYCVLIGTAILGGSTTVYIWHNKKTNQRYISTNNGNIIESKGVYAKDLEEATKRCLKIKPRNKKLKNVVKRKDVSGGFYYECEYR